MSEYPKVIETKAGTVFGRTVRRLTRVDSAEEEKRVREMDARSVVEADEFEKELLFGLPWVKEIMKK